MGSNIVKFAPRFNQLLADTDGSVCAIACQSGLNRSPGQKHKFDAFIPNLDVTLKIAIACGVTLVWLVGRRHAICDCNPQLSDLSSVHPEYVS